MVEVSFHNRDTGLGSLRVEDGYSVLPMGVQYGDCYAADFHGTSIEVESHLLNYRLADFIVGMLDLVVWMLMMGLEGSLTVPDL